MNGVAASPGAAWAQRLEAGRAQVRAQQRREHDLKAFESALGRAHPPRRGEPCRPPSPPGHRSTSDEPSADVSASAPLAAPAWAVPVSVPLPLPHRGMPMHGDAAQAASNSPPGGQRGGTALEAAPPQPPAAGSATQAGPQGDRWQFEVADAGSPLCGITVQRRAEGGFQVGLQTRPAAAGPAGPKLPLQPLRRRLAGHGAWLDDPITMEVSER